MSYNFKIAEQKTVHQTITKTALTSNTLDRFERVCNPDTLTAEQVERIEHLAYCANMGAESKESAWNHFIKRVKESMNIDIKEEHPNIRKAIADYQTETVNKFSKELETKTVADILASWYWKQYLTPKSLEALKNIAPEEKPIPGIVEKMKAKKAREEAKNTAKHLEALALAECYNLPERVSVSVEFTRSRTWGSIPHAAVTTEERDTFGTASGCGYDKESAAIASAMNQHPEIMRILYDYAESGKTFPYSVHTFAGLPSFDGGCGVSCFRAVFEACGYKWRQVGNGKTYNAYEITRK